MTKNVQIVTYSLAFEKKTIKKSHSSLRVIEGGYCKKILIQESKFSNISSNILDLTELGYHRWQQVEPFKPNYLKCRH